MHHKIINALARPGINPYYVIQNREFLIHLSLKDLFGFSFYIQRNIYWRNIQIELPLLVGTML
jgi:hypothetical protein